MCLVLEMGNFTNPNTVTKCKELWARQQGFTSHMKMATSWEIASLDFPGLHTAFQEHIMQLVKSKTALDSPRFHSVNCRDLRGPAKFGFIQMTLPTLMLP
ncbi:hypothetical protein ACA910_003119 [Epithemia clementina (nom. ined.)]